jgi:glycosyltransferase involved in cell wall biosynthesis
VRICHVSPHLPPDQAANALLPSAIGAWGHARGDAVSFVAHEPAQSGTAGHALESGCPVQWIPRRRDASTLSRLLRLDAMRVVRDVEHALDQAAGNADLVHLHSNGLIVEAAARWARRRRIPYVLTLYGTEIWHYRRRRPIDLFTRAYTGAAQVTFYSRFLMEKAEAMGLSRPGLSVVYPPVAERFVPRDASTRSKWRRELGIHEPRVILNVKRLHPLAAQADLIEAFALLARELTDVRLLICGTGPLQADLEALVRSRGLATQVTFAGLVPNDVVARYCAVADVFALPSLLEALPTVAVEALASGTPVVSADHPGGVELHELFLEDVAVVPRQNPRRLADALLASLAANRRTTAETAVTLEGLFGPPAVMAAYDAVYSAARRASTVR